MHPEFLTNRDRFERRAAINAIINAQIRKQPIAHWLEVLNAAGVPCGRVMSLKEVFDDPQIRHQQMKVTIEHPRYGPLDVLGFPIKFTDAPCRVHRVPPEPAPIRIRSLASSATVRMKSPRSVSNAR